VRRLPIVGALVVLLALAFAGSALACSCAPLAPGESLRESDAAIVGRLVEVVPVGRFRADYRYEVQRVYRGRRAIASGRMLSVRSARRSAACALPRRLDRDYGLFLTRVAGRWVSGICGVIEPRRLHFAAQRGPLASRGAGSPEPGACPA
jgi:hypothetical protein